MHIEQSSEEALIAEAHDRATRNVTTVLLLNEVAEREGITVTSDELDLAT
jgi:FKBP-type peptidyl-prolyl cis-trans isomerase (trigger factor)